MEILPFSTSQLPINFLPRSYCPELKQGFSVTTSRSSALGRHSCLSTSLMEMVSDPLEAFPQRQLERFPMLTTFFQILQGNIINTAVFLPVNTRKLPFQEIFHIYKNDPLILFLFKYFCSIEIEIVLGYAIWYVLRSIFRKAGISLCSSKRKNSTHTKSKTNTLDQFKLKLGATEKAWKSYFFLLCACHYARE